MKEATKRTYVILSTILCALAMSLVDGVIQPPYAVKSAMKVVLFQLVPAAYFLLGKEWNQLKALFLPGKRDLLIALCLGVGVYGFILGGYWVITRFFDLTDAILQLTSDGGVSADNFLWVSLYISFANSLLEEFLFRGFAFISLKKLTTRPFAYIFSAAVFACYHFGMVAGSSPLIWGMALIGLFIAGVVLNFLNEKSGSIVTSWLVHMFANLSINMVGFYVFGML